MPEIITSGCVRNEKAGMFSRRQTCRGRSQSPVVWIAEVMEAETLKPIDKVSPREAASHQGRNKGERVVASRMEVSPRAEPSTGGRRRMSSRRLTDKDVHLGGVETAGR